MNCPICHIMDEDKLVVYQDKIAVAYLAAEPAAEGHVIVAPREHYAIIEAVPDDVLTHLFIVANRVSTAVFELFGAQGTNIEVNNGIPAGQDVSHFSINVIPRKEGDNVNFKWQPKQMSQQEMESITAKVKDKCDYIGHQPTPVKPLDLSRKEIKIESEQDYRIRQLERLP